MTKIELNKDGSMDTYLEVCSHCKKSTGILLGTLYENTDTKGITHYASTPHKYQKECEQHGTFFNKPFTKVGPSTQIPTGLCDECYEKLADEQALFSEIVSQGGVYFKCKECHQTGAIKPNEFTASVRRSAGVEPPDPLGIEFSSCEEHKTY
jgi:hypothetical protein